MYWKVPHEVLEKFGELDYKIKIKGKVHMFHINMLKSYVEREDGVVFPYFA
jgi:CRISPR/Cas system-associated endonuclease Cas3-HD